jgi:ParB-like chromosome segregation protein Spo0J
VCFPIYIHEVSEVEIKSKEIELVGVNELIPHPKNPNYHSFDQIERLVKIIEYQGFRNPLVVQRGTNLVVAGNGRLQAAKKIGMEKVPVIYQEFDSEAQLYAHIVSDNAIAEWAEMDRFKIMEEVDNLGLDDLELLGIDDFKMIEESKDEGDGEEPEEKKNEKAIIKITCHQDLKDEVLIYLKAKLMETSFEGVHIE